MVIKTQYTPRAVYLFLNIFHCHRIGQIGTKCYLTWPQTGCCYIWIYLQKIKSVKTGCIKHIILIKLDIYIHLYPAIHCRYHFCQIYKNTTTGATRAAVTLYLFLTWNHTCILKGGRKSLGSLFWAVFSGPLLVPFLGIALTLYRYEEVTAYPSGGHELISGL